MSVTDNIRIAADYIEEGRRFEAQRDFSSAKKSFKKALRFLEQIAENTRTANVLRCMSEAYRGLSWIEQGMSDPAKAAFWGEKYLRTSEELHEMLSLQGTHVETAFAIQNMGDICMQKHDIRTAREYYLKARDIYEEELDRGDRAEMLRNLATVCGILGQLSRIRKNYPAALERMTESMNAWEEAADLTGETRDHQKLACCCFNHGIILEECFKYGPAKDMYIKSAENYSAAASKAEPVYFAGNAKDAYRAAAKAAQLLGNTQESDELQEMAADVNIYDLTKGVMR